MRFQIPAADASIVRLRKFWSSVGSSFGNAPMFRVASTGSLCLMALGLCGCTSFFTARAIDSFQAGLAAGDLATLESATSEAFQQRALRVAGALESLQVLPMPHEEGDVTEVEQISDDVRLLTLEVGDPPHIVKYRLKHEAASEDSRARWVVDDVILTQSRGEGKELLTKSVTEQMDVLLTVQEFLTTWRGGSREATLAMLHPELRARMESLAPVHLAQLTGMMLDGLKEDAFRPEARIQTQHAVVQLPRRAGKLTLHLEPGAASDPRWVIRDVVASSSREDEPDLSVAHLANCISQANQFLKAYQVRDDEALRRVASETFYTKALATADFSTAPLPVPQILATRFDIQEQDNHTDLLFEVGADTFLISMSRDAAPEVVLPEQRTSEPEYRIDELTIYERGGAQIKPLSAVFTAQAIVEVFAEALSQRDLALVSQLSTIDLNRRVWSRLDSPDVMKELNFNGIPSAPPRVVTTVFQGPVTEITVTQGTRALTYVLHAGQGRPQVDDIRFPSDNRVGSLKLSLEMQAPVWNFVSAWTRRDMDDLVQNSADSVRRMVWMRTQNVPEISAPLKKFLAAGPPKIEEAADDRIVTLGAPERGMQVRLVREHDRYVVATVHVVDPSVAGGRLDLVDAMRTWITVQEAKPIPRRSTTIAAGADAPSPQGAMAAVTPADAARTSTPPEIPVTASANASPGVKPTSTAPASTAAAVPLLQQPISIPGT